MLDKIPKTPKAKIENNVMKNPGILPGGPYLVYPMA